MRATLSPPYLALLQAGFTMPCLLPATRCALTAPFHPYPATWGKWPGGILSVALSVDSRRPGITWRPAPVEPGLSSAEPELIKNQSVPTAIARLTPINILGWNGNSVKPAPATRVLRKFWGLLCRHSGECRVVAHSLPLHAVSRGMCR